jgi:large subunit ribosomal protein L25
VSDEKISLELQKREVFGKAVKGLRNEGTVPAVIHDHGKDSLHVQASFVQLTKVYQAAGKHHPVELTFDGKNYLALIKDADFEPKKHMLRHVVFNAINRNETTTAEIPLVLVGEIPAEKASLMVLKHVETVEVEALPKDLIDELQVDASSLVENGDKIHVSDIKAPNGVTILTDPETTIATVEIPKDQVAEANEAAAEQAEADGTAAEVPADNGEPVVETDEEAK